MPPNTAVIRKSSRRNIFRQEAETSNNIRIHQLVTVSEVSLFFYGRIWALSVARPHDPRCFFMPLGILSRWHSVSSFPDDATGAYLPLAIHFYNYCLRAVLYIYIYTRNPCQLGLTIQVQNTLARYCGPSSRYRPPQSNSLVFFDTLRLPPDLPL